MIEIPGCNGDIAETIVYSKTRRAILKGGEWETVERIFDKLASGDYWYASRMEHLLQIPEVGKLWGAAMEGLVPVLKTGDQVVKIESGRAVVYTVGEIKSWRLTCRLDKSKQWVCIREFISESGETSEQNETRFRPISALEEHKALRKIVNTIKRDMGKAGLVGAYITHQGKTFKV